MKCLMWRAVAVISLLLGLLGIVLPGLPTVVFLLISAWAAGKGWSDLERWLLSHPRYGTPISQWRTYGAVPRRAKWAASVMMSISILLLWLSLTLVIVKALLSLLLLTIATWLWLRPEPPQNTPIFDMD
ncbi:YbaN family protein [Aliiglaciecola sp. CAU 1673]|uniref:YbaN family protein n=1 Tax=Aliiglaciecola sp. CAU 1673 TaxID=3032595 RepID=UPI0023DC910D|nr:YbaN family protein [Aliiglaciecola sp. CAU 1673]MDF2180172.1 YbaN family protein [Aliiglaciecola sp. CAU 1673]